MSPETLSLQVQTVEKTSSCLWQSLLLAMNDPELPAVAISGYTPTSPREPTADVADIKRNALGFMRVNNGLEAQQELELGVNAFKAAFQQCFYKSVGDDCVPVDTFFQVQPNFLLAFVRF
jgi:hypothetical protein